MSISYPPSPNAAVLEREFAWLGRLIDTAIRLHLGSECDHADVRALAPPDIGPADGASPYGSLVANHDLSFDHRAILALALAPLARPQLLDPFLIRNSALDRCFSEFGGVSNASFGGFQPTVETALFLLSHADLNRRFAVQALFEPDQLLHRLNLLRNDDYQGPIFSAPLSLSKEQVGRLTTGAGFRPAFNNSFPARRLTTPHGWNDLVLTDATLEDVQEIRAWIEHRQTLLGEWRLADKLKPGFRSLFYGPPGTGKTLTAALLGKATGLDVYRIDLSLVVSKWIGETEKNLAAVFDQAENNDWILFFDEADALFGKRTQTSSANDRYANQEVSYLLQRVEDFPSTVILATNLKSNIDEAFARRFQSMIFFPMPGPAERLRLWKSAFADTARLASSVDLEQIAAEFELSGGAIINVLRYAALMALRRGEDQVRQQDIRHGVRREFHKSGRTA